MARLIDADRLFLHLNDWAFAEAPSDLDVGELKFEREVIYRTINECMQAVEDQPTVYDADKAVKEMVDKRILEIQMEDYGQGYSDGYRAGSNYRELGCDGCAFESVEEWEMPCVRCKRGCKDYYRRAEKGGVE